MQDRICSEQFMSLSDHRDEHSLLRTLFAKAHLLRGQIPLRFDEMVFALDENWNVILLHDERFIP